MFVSSVRPVILIFLPMNFSNNFVYSQCSFPNLIIKIKGKWVENQKKGERNRRESLKLVLWERHQHLLPMLLTSLTRFSPGWPSLPQRFVLVTHYYYFDIFRFLFLLINDHIWS